MTDESRETPTPTTDGLAFEAFNGAGQVICAEDARTLEHALAAAKAEVERVVGEKDEADKLVNCLRLENRDLKDALIFEIEKRQAAETALRKEREKVIEECAKACRAIQKTYMDNAEKATIPHIINQWHDYATGAGACATELQAIRALKEKP